MAGYFTVLHWLDRAFEVLVSMTKCHALQPLKRRLCVRSSWDVTRCVCLQPEGEAVSKTWPSSIHDRRTPSAQALALIP